MNKNSVDLFLENSGRGIVISLADLTGNFTKPWVESGFSAVLVDPQHSHTHISERVLYAKSTIEECLFGLGRIIRSGRVVFVAGFPPCTDVAVSGARHFKAKLAKDPYCQCKASIVAEQCRTIGAISGAPYFWENPVSVFTNIFGPADHIFNPCDYTGWDPGDNCTKKTCLRVGNRFTIPPPLKDTTLGAPDDRIHKAPPSPERSNIRSATPMGFARAVFAANAPACLKCEGWKVYAGEDCDVCARRVA